MFIDHVQVNKKSKERERERERGRSQLRSSLHIMNTGAHTTGGGVVRQAPKRPQSMMFRVLTMAVNSASFSSLPEMGAPTLLLCWEISMV